MYQIHPIVGKGRESGRSRAEENIITRLRLGHTRLNSTMHLIKKEPTGLCKVCGVRETVEHAIMYCREYIVDRNELKNEIEKMGEQFSTKYLLNSGRNIKTLLLQFTNLNKRV